MAHALDPVAPIGPELRRVLLAGLRQARTDLKKGATEPGVHKARKACKRARAAADLAARGLWVGSGVRLDRVIRDAARNLGEIRDSDVMRGWVDQLGLAVEVEPVADREERGKVAVRGLEAAIRLTQTLPFDAVDTAAVVEALAKSWGACRKTFRAVHAETTSETMHEWRKATKRLMYQAELVCPRFPELAPVVVLLDGLQEELGNHHDLLVLDGFSASAELQQRAAAIEPHVLACGRWLFRDSGKAFGRWIATRPGVDGGAGAL